LTMDAFFHKDRIVRASIPSYVKILTISCVFLSLKYTLKTEFLFPLDPICHSLFELTLSVI